MSSEPHTAESAGNGWLPLSSRSLCHLPAAAAASRWLAAAMVLAVGLAPAQEALWSPLAAQAAAQGLRNSMTGEAAAAARQARPESLPYTVKTGDFRLLVTPSLGLDWNDNINVSDSNPESDFILKPLLQLNASYPVTDRNLLRLTVGVGYDKYFQHDNWSGWVLQSGSELSFDMYIKDFWINLHDRFSYTEDPAQQAALANTTSQYTTINNTAGLLTTWDLEDVVLNLGYDHENVWYPTQQYEYQNRATELILGRAGLRVHPRVTTGVEGTVALTSYEQMVLNDNTGYSAGVYADWQPGPYFRVQPRAGYTIYQFQPTSQAGFQRPGQPIRTSDVNAWYAGLNVTHQITDAVSYSLDAGHETQLGIQADMIEDSYVRANANWNIVKNLTLTTSLFYEHGDQGQGNVTGNLTETFDWYGGSLGLRHDLTKRLVLSLNYRLTLRSSDSPNRDYTQNLVGLLLTYNIQ
jgi:hypothetical protein